MNLLDTLRTHRLLAIVRGDDPDAALAAVLTLAECGVRLIEVSLTSTDAPGVLRRACAALGADHLLGAGTVLTVDDARQAAEAGASYLVTPALAPSLAEGTRLGLPVLAGALTPTEVAQANTGGATAVKLFPASLGGPDYLRALRDPFPHTPFVPVGGARRQRRRHQVAGAGFGGLPGVVDGEHRAGAQGVVGALTPTEVAQANTGGATAVKLFPASLGGPDYLRALRDPFPHTPFVPVGGVNAESARAYLDRGAIAVGVGSPLLGDATAGGDLRALRRRVADFLAAVEA